MIEYWGPITWVFLHTISFSYPNKPTKIQMLLYLKFLNLINTFIQCPICKRHFRELLHKYPILSNIDSRDKLIHYFFMLHNIVNHRLGKKDFSNNELYNKYSFNNKLEKGNHHIVNQYILYLKKKVLIYHIQINDFITFIRLLRVFHPCIKCRNELNKYNQKKNLKNYIHSRTEIFNWLDGIFNDNILNKEHLKC